MNTSNPKNITPFELFEWMHGDRLKPFLIDVRERNELEIASLPFEFLNLPLSESNKWIGDLTSLLPRDRPIVVICHAGIRSLNFANWLIQQNLNSDVCNLEGGIDKWSITVDTNLPRY